MPMTSPPPIDGLLAIDVGNSRVKLGWFPSPGGCTEKPAAALPIAAPALRAPESVLAAAPDKFAEIIDAWLEALAACPATVAIASVCPPVSETVRARLASCFARLGTQPSVAEVTAGQATMPIAVAAPDRVGIDRIAAAVAADTLRPPGTPAIVIDIGTAITVDLIDADGAFVGGAILPGPRLAAQALAERTAFLPQLELNDLDQSPDAVGGDTESAMQAGLYWGAVGAVREVIARQRDRLTKPPRGFLTGGASPAFAKLLATPDYTVRHVPHLTLSGVALLAERTP